MADSAVSAECHFPTLVLGTSRLSNHCTIRLVRRAFLKRAADDHRVEALQPTGIPILDKVTGGGFPRPSAIALLGPIGSGKSMLVWVLVTNFIRQGCSRLYYCIDDPADIVLIGLEDHTIDVYRME